MKTLKLTVIPILHLPFVEMYEHPSENDADAPPPKYQHVVIPGNRDRNESYLTLALEAALIGILT